MASSMTLDSMIASLDQEDTLAVQKFVMFLLESKKSRSPQKKDALKRLSQFRGILDGEDRDALRDAAMEEKYGPLS